MDKNSLISQIEKTLSITLTEASIRGDNDILSAVMPYKVDKNKKRVPKYALDGERLIGLNLSNIGLTDERWAEVMALPGFESEDIQALNLSRNQLTEFQPNWGFENLSLLSLTDNPLVIPPEEITSQGNKAILNYLLEFKDDEEVIVYEAKLLIVGEAGVGKTTLARKLKDPTADMPKEVEDTTKGIDVEPLLIQEEGKPDFVMHVWDFGGQEIYHSTHQFFLSKRSLYVFVLDGRNEEDHHYWLQVQDLLGEDSPILLLLNKKGTIRTQVPFKELRGYYQNLRSPKHEFSLKDNSEALESFSKFVFNQIRNLPHFLREEKVPGKWKKIRTRLEKLAETQNYISLENYREVCKKEGIKDPDRQDFLSDFLHSLGAILHFSKVPLLDKMLILNPTWATDAVYKVLNHTEEFADTPGHFTRKELDKVWKDNSYRDVFNELLALMEKFDLCYQLPDNEDEYIVPQLLSPDKPLYKWRKEGQIQMIYDYTFMPKGIVTRLIVRLHRYIENQETVWQRGAVFEYELAQAEVVELYREKKILIKSTGASRKAFMTIITHEIDSINRTFDFDKRLKVSQLIPCNCGTCQNQEEPYFFSKHDLNKARSKNRKTIECRNSFDDVSIHGLMEDVFTKEAFHESMDRERDLPEENPSHQGEEIEKPEAVRKQKWYKSWVITSIGVGIVSGLLALLIAWNVGASWIWSILAGSIVAAIAAVIMLINNPDRWAIKLAFTSLSSAIASAMFPFTFRFSQSFENGDLELNYSNTPIVVTIVFAICSVLFALMHLTKENSRIK